MRWMAMPLAMLLATTAATTEPAAKAGEDAFARLQAQLERDGTPRERALVSQFYKAGPDDSAARAHGGQILRDAAAAAPADPLVQWLWATAPLAATGCPGDAACAGRAWAAARLDPDNAAAWGPVLAAALKSQDAEAVHAALDQMARGSHYAEPFAEVVDAWRGILRRHPWPSSSHEFSPYRNARPLENGEADAVAAVAFAAALVSPIHGVYTLCDAQADPAVPAEVLERCLRIARLMQDSPTVMQRMMGIALQRRAGGPEDPAFDRQRDWWTMAWAPMEDDGREAMRYFDDLVSTGSEIRAIELALQRAGKPLAPPADWVYVSPFADVAAAAEKAAAEARAEADAATAAAAKAPARPARP